MKRKNNLSLFEQLSVALMNVLTIASGGVLALLAYDFVQYLAYMADGGDDDEPDGYT